VSPRRRTISQGGTIIGTARSKEFRTFEGRHLAAANLIKRGIDSMIVIGGDGSLTGANMFRKEWPEHVQKLLEEGAVEDEHKRASTATLTAAAPCLGIWSGRAAGQITKEQAEAHPVFSVVGLVGSIDNDMCGTDMTIGCDTALHRVMEALDSLASTAASHQRAFVVEVMGRNCGWLALWAAIAAGADWLFIPEAPPDYENWEQRMCDKLTRVRRAPARAWPEGGRRPH